MTATSPSTGAASLEKRTTEATCSGRSRPRSPASSHTSPPIQAPTASRCSHCTNRLTLRNGDGPAACPTITCSSIVTPAATPTGTQRQVSTAPTLGSTAAGSDDIAGAGEAVGSEPGPGGLWISGATRSARWLPSLSGGPATVRVVDSAVGAEPGTRAGSIAAGFAGPGPAGFAGSIPAGRDRAAGRPTAVARNQVANAVTATPMERRRRPWPVEEARRVPRGASMRACSARNLAAPPRTVRAAAVRRMGRAPGGGTRANTARPVTAAPTRTARPA